MQDVQNRQDKRGIAIQKVGIKEAHLPFLIKTKEGGYQQVLARVRFTVALPSQYKGTHMSRFLEILMPWSKKPLAETEMEAMLSEALERLEAHSAEVELSFKYFVDKVAPVSRRTSVLDLDCSFTGRKEQGKPMEFQLGVEVPFTSLCPCSKEISSYGAHNQRSVARIQLRFKEAGVEFGRFIINTTAGVGGLVDVAKNKKTIVPVDPSGEDFGQTLGRWGIPHGFYLVWPILGPSSLRETVGMAGDYFVYPSFAASYIIHPWYVPGGVSAGFFFNDLDQVLPTYFDLKKAAVDPYIMMREAYVKYRAIQVAR